MRAKKPVGAPPSEFAVSLGNRLRNARRRRGMSLAAVAEASGGQWPPAVIGSYERGSRSIAAEKLSGLAKFYEVPLSELLPDDGTPTVEQLLAGIESSISTLREAVTW